MAHVGKGVLHSLVAGLAITAVACGTEPFSVTKTGADVARRPIGRTATLQMDVPPSTGETVALRLTRRFGCEASETYTFYEDRTTGRRVGGAGRRAEWYGLAGGSALMLWGAMISQSSERRRSGDAPPSFQYYFTGFALAGVSGLFLLVDHGLTHQATARVVTKEERRSKSTPCGEEPAAGVDFTVHGPAGTVQGRTDDAGRATVPVPRSLFGPRTGTVIAPVTVEGRLIGEVSMEVAP